MRHLLLAALGAAALSGCVVETAAIPVTGAAVNAALAAPPTWTEVSPGAPYNAAAFLDPDLGWVVGPRDPRTGLAIIRKTTNGGYSWSVQDAGTDRLDAVNFLSPAVGFAAGENGALLATIDGGLSWQTLDSGTTEEIVDVKFFDRSHGLFLTPGSLYETLDGGDTWQRRASLSNAEEITLVDADSAAVATGAGDFMFADGGLSPAVAPANDWPAQMSFARGAAQAWGTSPTGSLFKSFDGGASWNAVRHIDSLDGVDSVSSAMAVSFANPHDGMLLVQGAAMTTDDGGLTWERDDESLDFSSSYRYFRLFDADHAWAFGDGQTLYRYSN